MQADRRQFLKLTVLGASTVPLLGASTEAAEHHHEVPAGERGVLVDLTECIGCRRCEFACKQANGMEAGDPQSYEDLSVFRHFRRPDADAFTVINSYLPRKTDEKPVYVKTNCLHCLYPACESACIVGAIRQQENGAVTYDASKCIGCRYCMVACPFQIPAYEYDSALTPRVRKCELCFAERTSRGKLPACVEACPRNVMKFGRRQELLDWAHARIAKNPDKYVNHIYGEHEVGGTAWMYMSAVPFEKVGFLKLSETPPPQLTEAIQHGVFKHWIAPIGWYSFLSLMFWVTGRKAKAHPAHATAHHRHPDAYREHDLLTLGHYSVARLRGSADADAIFDPAAALFDPPEREEPHHDVRAHGAHHPAAAPTDHKLLTPGVWALIALVGIGAILMLYRFVVGLAATTNLDQQHPWGLWIAMDVGSGIALAGGGFVSAAVIHVFHREHYHALARSALLTALLGYTFYVPGLLADIGRWYNIWHPTMPWMWQGNSVLFEVGICVMIYLNVQYAELAPIICERLLGEAWIKKYPRLHRLVGLTQKVMNRIMPALLVLGVTLSTFHQSSLGNLMVIAPFKLHPLWWTPVSPLLFVLSAMMVGFPMVIFTILFASWCLHRRPEMRQLTPLAGRYVPVFIVMYLGVKVGDMIVRRTYVYFNGSLEGTLWLVEVCFGVILPLVLFFIPRVRKSPRALAVACLLVILGVVLNRLNVFVIGYHPPFSQRTYIPSLTEFGVSIGLVAALMLVYRVAVTYLPILEPRPRTT